MRKMRSTIFVACVVLMSLGATSALAQSSGLDEPWTGQTYPREELINLGSYDSLPVKFPWKVVEERQVPVDSRLDFVLTLDEDPQEVLQQLEDAADNRRQVATLAEGAVPFQRNGELRVLGHSVGDTPVRFTLGGDGSYRFQIEVSAEGAQTQLVLRNFIMAELFSGVVPARAPFKPRSADPVNFLWN